MPPFDSSNWYSPDNPDVERLRRENAWYGNNELPKRTVRPMNNLNRQNNLGQGFKPVADHVRTNVEEDWYSTHCRHGKLFNDCDVHRGNDLDSMSASTPNTLKIQNRVRFEPPTEDVDYYNNMEDIEGRWNKAISEYNKARYKYDSHEKGIWTNFKSLFKSNKHDAYLERCKLQADITKAEKRIRDLNSERLQLWRSRWT